MRIALRRDMPSMLRMLLGVAVLTGCGGAQPPADTAASENEASDGPTIWLPEDKKTAAGRVELPRAVEEFVTATDPRELSCDGFPGGLTVGPALWHLLLELDPALATTGIPLKLVYANGAKVIEGRTYLCIEGIARDQRVAQLLRSGAFEAFLTMVRTGKGDRPSADEVDYVRLVDQEPGLERRVAVLTAGRQADRFMFVLSRETNRIIFIELVTGWTEPLPQGS